MTDEEEGTPGTAERDDTAQSAENGTEDADEETFDENAVAGMYDQSANAESSLSETQDTDGEEDESDAGQSSGMFDSPLLNQDGEEPETSAGTFYVKYAQESAATLHEVNTAQICTLVDHPGLETHDIIEATLVAQPPMQVSYVIQDLQDHYTIPIETSSEPPTQQVMEIASEMDVDEAVAIEREGKGEIHILRVNPEYTSHTAEELYDDEMTYKNAARYETVERVEIRTDEDEGVVSIRYLP